MFNRIKEYLTSNPNSSIWTALICSLTAMSTDEWVSLLAAFGLFISTLVGLIHKAISDYVAHNENKTQKEYDRRINLMKASDESERYKIENQMLMLKLDIDRQALLASKIVEQDGNA